MNPLRLPLAARRRGISLIEGVLYLVIALAVIVGGIVFFQQAQLSSQTMDLQRALMSSSSQLLDAQQKYSDGEDVVMNDYAIKAAILPATWSQESSGGFISAPGIDKIAFTTLDSQVKVHLLGMSPEVCMRVAAIGEDGTSSVGADVASVSFSSLDTGLISDPAVLINASHPTTLTAGEASPSAVANSCATATFVTITYGS